VFVIILLEEHWMPLGFKIDERQDQSTEQNGPSNWSTS
jgi:hypothetical protein